MRTILSNILFITFIFSAGAAWAAEEWAGKWTMTSMTLKVDIESWGEHCGPQPVSYASKQARPVEISAQGGHLIFSNGGMRTDKCGSPNPRLQTVSQTASPGNWRRVCQTEDSDPKYERGEYSLVAKQPDRLEYTAQSKFDWTLKGDHCIARSTEKRIYVRDTETSKETTRKQDEVERENGDKTQILDLDFVPPACEAPGPAKRISVHPRSARLGPGQRICFKAVAIDENGCRTEINPSWAASQDGRSADGLISQAGCFKAGDTAADSEGLYSVIARAEGKSYSAEVTVVFPDLGELLAARLKPLEDLQEDAVEDGGYASIPAPKLSLVPLPPKTGANKPGQATPSKSGWISAVILFFLGIAVIGLIIAISMLLKQRAIRRKRGGEPEQSEATNRDSALSSSKPDAGMVCPKCNRGYDSSARFCPHDSEKLVPYLEWRTKSYPARTKI
jgi:hypothetical protein